MPRPPKNAQRTLPWRMYKHGLAYRIVNLDGSKVPLGRDYEVALRRYYIIMAQRSEAPQAISPGPIFQRHKKGAKQRGLAFTITEADVAALLEQQGSVCAVTGLPFKFDKPDGIRIRPWAPSLDRINGKQGYEPGNVRIVCAFVNVAMNGFGEAFFEQVLGPLIDAAVKARLLVSENGQPAASNTAMGISVGKTAGQESSHADFASTAH